MKKRWMLLIALFSLPVVLGQRFGYDYYGGYYGGYAGGLYGLLDLQGLYYTYPEIIDFLVFFLIFAGVSRLVFTKMFGDQAGAKALYIGLGLALSIGGVFYGYLSLDSFGRYAVPFAVLIGGVALYGFLTMFKVGKWAAILLTLGLMLLGIPLFDSVGGTSYGGYLLGFSNAEILSWIMGILIVLGIIFMLVHLVRNWRPGDYEDRGGEGRGRGDSGNGGGGGGSGGDSSGGRPGFLRRLGGSLLRGTKVAGSWGLRKGKEVGKALAAKSVDLIRKSIIEFNERQHNRLVVLHGMLNEWMELEDRYQRGENVQDAMYRIRHDLENLLMDVYQGTRNNLQMLIRTEDFIKKMEASRLDRGHNIDDRLRNLLVGLTRDLRKIRVRIYSMIHAVRKNDYNRASTLYKNIRIIHQRMIDAYNQINLIMPILSR